MASVPLKKADKIEALNNMTKAKYLDQYKALMNRRNLLARRVYDDTIGKEGWAVAAAVSKKHRARDWLIFRSHVELEGVSFPCTPTGERRHRGMGRDIRGDLFSGVNLHTSEGEEWTVMSGNHRMISLPESLPWPDNKRYSDELKVEEAGAPTKKVAATLERDIKAFNEEVSQFYNEAWGVLQDLRTTRQVDNMFPELWDYLPGGLRERLKQGLIPLDQSSVDALRAKLPKKRRNK